MRACVDGICILGSQGIWVRACVDGVLVGGAGVVRGGIVWSQRDLGARMGNEGGGFVETDRLTGSE